MLKKGYFEILGLIFLLILIAKFTQGYFELTDLSFVDEQGYLNSAFDFGNKTPAREYSPIYVGVLALFTQFSSDPLVVQNTFHLFLTFAVVIAFYFLLIKMNVPVLVAIIFSWLYLINPLQLPVSTKVQILASCLVFILLAFGFGIKNIINKLFCFLFGFFILCYVRPEFKVSFILLSIIALVYFLLQYFRDQWTFQLKDKWLNISILICLLFGGIIIWVWGQPFSDNSNRTFLAFGQHFAYNMNQFRNIHSELNPFVYWEIYVFEYFGKVNSIHEAFLANPKEFLLNIYQNIKSLSWITIEYGFGMLWPFHQNFRIGKFSIILYLICFFILYKGYKKEIEFKKIPASVIFDFVLLVLCFLPSLIGQLVVAPRFHSYNFQYPMVSLIMLFFIFHFFNYNIESNSGVIVKTSILVSVVFSFLLIFTPAVSENSLIQKSQNQYMKLRNVQTELGDLKESTILSDEMFLVNYINPEAKFSVFKPTDDLNKRLKDNAIKVFAANEFTRIQHKNSNQLDIDSLLSLKGFKKLDSEFNGYQFYKR